MIINNKNIKIFLFLLLGIFSILINNHYGNIGIFAIDSLGFFDTAYSILLDKHPFKDFWIFSGPLVDYIQAAFFKEMGHITPKVGTDAAIFNEQGQILLMDRVDGSGWCLPCGWLEPNETPAQAIVREVKEETGLDVNVTRLVGVFTRFPETDFSPHTMVAVVHLCEVLGGELTLSHEGLDLKYWDLDAPIRWHANHAHYARMADQCRRLGDGFQAVSA